ncbi:unnamed protein product, partial [Ilex paraguariensis]
MDFHECLPCGEDIEPSLRIGIDSVQFIINALFSRLTLHNLIGFTFMQIDDVISQAQTTRATLGSQRALFGDVQGKVKQLGDKFPIIRGLIGTILNPFLLLSVLLLTNFPLILSLILTGSIKRKRSRDTLILSAVIA